MTRPAVVVSTRDASRSRRRRRRMRRDQVAHAVRALEPVRIRAHTEAREGLEVGAPLLDLFVFLRHTRVRVVRVQPLADALEDAVDELHGLGRAERFGQLQRLVDDDRRRRLGLVQELVHGEPQDQAVHAPACGRAASSRRSLRSADRSRRCARQCRQPGSVAKDRDRSDTSGASSSPMSQNEATHLGHREAPDLPLIEHLQRGLAAAAPPAGVRRRVVGVLAHVALRSDASSACEQRRHLDRRHRGFPPLVGRHPARRARSPLRPSSSSARRTPSARPSPPPRRSARATPPTRCSRSAASRRE